MDWSLCDGSLLPISQYEALFTLIGTTYGGDGVQTFALPDLRGRVPVHQGTGNAAVIGEQFGAEAVTITAATLPAHSHTLSAASAAATPAQGATGGLPGGSIATPLYATSGPTAVQAASAVSPAPAAGGQPHSNMAPSLCTNFIISLFGIFPSQG